MVDCQLLTLQILCILFCLEWSSTFAQDSEIKAIGAYANEKYEWAYGVPKLEFLGKANCNLSAVGCYVWFLGGSRLFGVDTFNDACVCSKANNMYDHQCDCHYDAGSNSITSNLTLNGLNSSTNLSIGVGQDSTDFITIKLIQFKYCPMLDDTENKLKLVGGVNATFEELAIYSCEHPATLLLNETIFVSTENYVRSCEFNARWNVTDKISCSYSPEPKLNISSSLSSSLGQFYEDEDIILMCEDLGNPPAQIPTYRIEYWNGTQNIINYKFLLKPECNGANLSCEASNEYTEKFELPAVKSVPARIEVLFAPIPSNDFSEMTASIGESIDLVFDFFANPYIQKTSLNLTFEDRNGTSDAYVIPIEGIVLLNNSGNSPYEMRQSCSYLISNVTAKSYGLYALIAQSTEKKFLNKTLKMFINLTEPDLSATSPTNVSTSPDRLPAIIGGSVAGFLVVILIMGYVIYKCRKKSQPKNIPKIKEEKENPIYGTSTAGNSAGNAFSDNSGYANSSKEERLNPLYDSNPGTQEGVEEAYAAVDVRKKKKNKANKGTENAAFSSESNAAVYAAVDKSKKKKIDKPPVEAVYSEVNKKKGSKNDTALHGSSQ